MRIVFVIGYVPYDYKNKLVEKYPDVIWVFEDAVRIINSAEAIVTLTKFVDEIMFFGKYISDNEKNAWQVACVMLHKKVVETSSYPVDDESEEENAETV